MKILLKVLYAISFSIVMFPNYNLFGHSIFAGGLFLISLIPSPAEELPKKVSICLSFLLLVISTVMIVRAVIEQTNVPIALTAYVVLVSIIAWNLHKEIKATPKANNV